MPVYVNVDGVWEQVLRPYVKKNDVWAAAREMHVRDSGGVWRKAYEYDVTPPDPPEISLEIIQGRYIKIGVRLANLAHDTDLAKIRVLVGTADKYPGSYEDATYLRTSDSTYPNEPWSEYYYNGYRVGTSKDHNDSSAWVYKQYPVNPTDSTNLAGGRYYRFAAWSMDLNGNWSVGTTNAIFMPKTGDTSLISKRARFQANTSGTFTSNVWVPGDLKISASNTHGFWFYGRQMRESIGQQGTPTISNAQIQMTRLSTDGGTETSNVYLGRYGGDVLSPTAPSGEPQPAQPALTEIAKLGTIKKGESKWFDIPKTYWADLNSNTTALGLWHKDPAKAAQNADDKITIKGVNDVEGQVRSGELYVTWTEKPS